MELHRGSTLLFATHAGHGIGGGHLSRCTALAQGFHEIGLKTSWLVNDEAADIIRGGALGPVAASEHPFSFDAIADLHSTDHFDALVVDTYTADELFYKDVKSIVPLIIISDQVDHPGSVCADVIIDYAIGSEKKKYRHDKSSLLLLGSKYALLRSNFWDLATSDDGRVIVIPGASDVAEANASFVEWWSDELPDLVVVCGPYVGDSYHDRVVRLSEKKTNVQVLRAPKDLPRLIANAGTVICTASVTMNEALALKKKTLIFSVADNQEMEGTDLHYKRCVCDLGRWGDVSRDDLISALSFVPDQKALEALVDPRGAIRCARAIVYHRR